MKDEDGMMARVYMISKEFDPLAATPEIFAEPQGSPISSRF